VLTKGAYSNKKIDELLIHRDLMKHLVIKGEKGNAEVFKKRSQ
jgi:hypothetical protein